MAIWKTLSIAGRLTLIKVVLSNLLIYYLSIFKIPRGVATKLVKLQRNFFGGVSSDRKKMALVSWDSVD